MRFPASLLLASFLMVPAAEAQPAGAIEGKWRVQNGETVTFRPCTQGFCSRIDTGEYAGGSVGWMRPADGRYEGEVVDPTTGTAYQGHASVAGNRLTLTGCVARVFCRSQHWTR